MRHVKQISSTGSLARYQRQYRHQKDQLRRIGYICMGSLAERRLSCGKATCACHRDISKQHGPYHQWTRKVGGKTQSRMLPESLVRLYREGIRNHRKLDRVIKQMQEISLLVFEAVKIQEKA